MQLHSLSKYVVVFVTVTAVAKEGADVVVTPGPGALLVGSWKEPVVVVHSV